MNLNRHPIPWLKQASYGIFLAAFDSLALTISYNIVYFTKIGHLPLLSGTVIAIALLWILVSYLLGRYSGRYKTNNATWLIPAQAFSVIFIVTVMAGALDWIIDISDPRMLPTFFLPTVFCSAFFSSIAHFQLYKRLSRRQSWLIIGTKAELRIIIKELEISQPYVSLEIEYFNSEEAVDLYSVVNGKKFHGIAVGDRKTLTESTLDLVLSYRLNGCNVQSLVSWCEHFLQRVPPEILTYEHLPSSEVFELNQNVLGWRIKRLGDLVLASMLLVLTFPIICICALLITIEDSGPIFFSQVRTGIYGNRFRLRKLRTMRQGADKNGARWATRSDPRITLVGNWLRRLRLDELPQLWNVLKGEMSLIGPRPEIPELETELEIKIPHYRIRHWIRPGLSGWAQVCHPYGASVSDSRRKLSYDLYYMRNFSVILDFLILMRTIRIVSQGAGSQPER